MQDYANFPHYQKSLEPTLPGTIARANKRLKSYDSFDRSFEKKVVTSAKSSTQKVRVMHNKSLLNIIPHPDNPKKCQLKGCFAWRKRGHRFCGPVHAKMGRAGSMIKGKNKTSGMGIEQLQYSKKTYHTVTSMSIRDLYKKALGDDLGNMFDSLAGEEAERLNVSSEVDLSRVTLAKTAEAIGKLFEHESASDQSKIKVMAIMRKSIKSHLEIVQDYQKVSERAAVATPEKMKLYFARMRSKIVDEFFDEDNPENNEMVERIWNAIKAVEIPTSTDSTTVKVEIV